MVPRTRMHSVCAGNVFTESDKKPYKSAAKTADFAAAK
jgi:hypothetical protein